MKKLKCYLPVIMDDYNRKQFAVDKPRLTQVDLASATGVAQSTISRMYTGSAKRYDAFTLERLCKFFKCEVGDMLKLVEVSEK